MERALGQFMLDVHTGEHGYTEVNPPLMVRDDVCSGQRQLPKFEEDQFHCIERNDELKSLTKLGLASFYEGRRIASIDVDDRSNREKLDAMYDEEISEAA